MKKILLIVAWFFILTFLSVVVGILGSVALYVAGFKSESEFFDEKIWPLLFILTMVLALALGLYGLLPGTKQTYIISGSVRFENKGFKYLVLRIGLMCILLLITMPIGELFVWLTKTSSTSWIGFLITVLYILGIGWFANKTAEHMAFEGLNMFSAMKDTFGDLRFRLAFLPIIGNWFAPTSKDTASNKEDGD